MSEQREHPRYAIELDCELVMAGGARTVRGRTHDISRGGFCLLTAPGIAVEDAGTACGIRLALVFSETEFSEQLSLNGTVMWSTKLREGVQFGVKFDELDAQSRGYLDLFMKFLAEGTETTEADDSQVDDPRR